MYAGCRAAIELVARRLRTQGPYDGIMGFSQVRAWTAYVVTSGLPCKLTCVLANRPPGGPIGHAESLYMQRFVELLVLMLALLFLMFFALSGHAWPCRCRANGTSEDKRVCDVRRVAD